MEGVRTPAQEVSMVPHRPVRLAALAVFAAVALAVLSAAAHAGALSTSAAAASPTQILVQWSWWEDPAYPTGHPEWVGYDLYRRATGTCGDWVRLNPDVIARVPGQVQDLSFLDSTPATATAYQYQVRLVDVSRVQLFLLAPACYSPCSPPAFAMCPDLSAPLIEGTVTDWGWAVLVQGCQGSCWGGFYISNPAADALRPYAGTGQAVRVWGPSGCGSIEGCGMGLDHFELTACISTPARRTTWGALKSHYR
jgi:hypothetical protein